MSLEQVSDWVRDRDSAALLGALRTKVVRPGDAMLVPAGLPHTVQSGVFVLELQEPTDLSILLEWQDFAVDGVTDGHLNLGFETALQAVDRRSVSEQDLDRLVLAREQIEGAGLTSIMPPQADAYFRAHRIDTSAGPVDVEAGFSVVLVLEGSGIIHSDEASSEVARGDVALIPFAAGTWNLHGDARAVACRPPAPDSPANPR